MRKLVRALVVAVALSAPAYATFHADDASASVVYESPYTLEQTFGTAVRLVRVDLGCKITESSQDNGYVLFDYKSSETGKTVHHGSLEVVRGKNGAHVSVQLPTLPSYHEQMIIDALAKKLLAEHGEPPRHKPQPAPPVEDAGTDAQAP